MKKYFLLLVLSLLMVLTACSSENAEDTIKPNNSEENNKDTKSLTESDAEPEEGDSGAPFALEGEIENYIDGMVHWTSFEMYNDFYQNSDAEDAINEEYHEEWKYVSKPLQMYFSGHSIGFSNMQFEQYATETEAYMNENMSEWVAVDADSVDLNNPIDRRMSLLNVIVSSAGVVSSSDLEYVKTIDAADMITVMNELFKAMFSVSFDEEMELSAVEAIITVDGERITNLEIIANGTDADGNSVEYDFTERYENINGFTEIASPVK